MRLLRSLFGPPTPRPAPRFRPTLQSLDARDVPAVISMGVNSAGTLVLQTDSANDNITLTDRGGTVANGNTIDAVINGSVHRFVGVKGITLQDAGSTPSGRNNITYNATTDTPIGLFIFQGSVAPAGHATNAGNDFVQVNLNGLTTNRDMSVILLGGDGSDSLNTRLAGRYRAGADLSVHTQGGLGWDVVGVNAWGTGAVSDVGSTWNVALFANTPSANVLDTADNNVSFWALGRMDGNITFDVQGGSRNDWVSTNLWFNQGSRATVGNGRLEGARVLGHGGVDDMELTIRGSHTENLLRFNRLTVDGGTGLNHQLTTAATPPPALRTPGAFTIAPSHYNNFLFLNG